MGIIHRHYSQRGSDHPGVTTTVTQHARFNPSRAPPYFYTRFCIYELANHLFLPPWNSLSLSVFRVGKCQSLHATRRIRWKTTTCQCILSAPPRKFCPLKFRLLRSVISWGNLLALNLLKENWCRGYTRIFFNRNENEVCIIMRKINLWKIIRAKYVENYNKFNVIKHVMEKICRSIKIIFPYFILSSAME